MSVSEAFRGVVEESVAVANARVRVIVGRGTMTTPAIGPPVGRTPKVPNAFWRYRSSV
jgi:hypothetical protein